MGGAFFISLLGVALTALPGVSARFLVAQGLTPEKLLQPSPDTWPTYNGDYSGRRFSTLDQINSGNISSLALAWAFRARTAAIKSTPLEVNGILYLTTPDNVWAVDARFGHEIWHYRRVSQGDHIGHRGVGMYGDWLYFTTPDAHLVSLNAKDGSKRWDIELADPKLEYFSTMSPLVVRNHVLVGVSGDVTDIPGFLDSVDPETGKMQWRWYTEPRPGEPGSETWPKNSDAILHGGGMTWMTGTYDPDLNLVYWGTGNAGPDYNGLEREGDNLYTASIVALDADTGKLRWHYQFTPHDIWDYDSTQMPVLADLTLGGELWKAVLFANRNGFFYVLDRATGKLIRGKPFIQTTWATGIRPDGRPMLGGNSVPSEEGTKVCPDQSGGTNWMPPSFDPGLGLFFVTARESCGIFFSWKDDYNAGDAFRGGAVQRLAETNYSALRAIDVATGERRWEFPYTVQSWAGVLSTASGVVFAGGSGNLMAFDAKSGKHLWHFQTGSSLYAGAITYMVDNRQYVLMPSGTTLTAFALAEF